MPKVSKPGPGKAGNPKHRVTLCKHARPASGARKRKGDPGRGAFGQVGGKGGRLQLFAFSWADLGAVLGLEPAVVQKLARPEYSYVYEHKDVGKLGKRKLLEKKKVRDALFDPVDLGSVVSYVLALRLEKLRVSQLLDPERQLSADQLEAEQRLREKEEQEARAEAVRAEEVELRSLQERTRGGALSRAAGYHLEEREFGGRMIKLWVREHEGVTAARFAGLLAPREQHLEDEVRIAEQEHRAAARARLLQGRTDAPSLPGEQESR